MRLEKPRSVEHFGSVRINEVQRVIQLDTGRKTSGEKLPPSVCLIDEENIRDIQTRMAVVLLIKNENVRLFEGVLSAIPRDCLIIVVSNSQRMNGLDRFKTEREVLNRFCKLTHQKAFIVHQKDQKFAQALKDVEYIEILGDDELVRDGKSEGMIMAILMAKLLGKDYIGFIDTDNFVPGSVWEYVKIYANGFSMTTTPYAMVRVLWIYKRHFHGRNKLFRKRGRVSSINNQFLNSLIGRITGFESDIIQTSCAGEHAMTLKLAETLPFASGYAVETYELAYIMERFGGIKPVLESEIATHGIEVSQIESRNPHVHELRGRESHIIREMLLPSLSSICYSPLCDQNLRERILKILISEGCLGSGERPPPPQIYPPVKNIDFERFAKVIEPQLSTYSALSRKKP